MKRFNLFKCMRIALYTGLFLALFLLVYTDIINLGSCYIYDTLGILCPACGITRATQAIFNFNFLLAIEYNAYYTLVLFPIFMTLLIDDIICIIFNKKSFVDIIFDE